MYDISKAFKSDSEMTFHEMSISFSYELSHRIPYETHKRHPLQQKSSLPTYRDVRKRLCKLFLQKWSTTYFIEITVSLKLCEAEGFLGRYCIQLFKSIIIHKTAQSVSATLHYILSNFRIFSSYNVIFLLSFESKTFKVHLLNFYEYNEIVFYR